MSRVQNSPSSEDEPQDDADVETTTEGVEGAEGAAVEGGGDNTAEANEDPATKDDDEQEEDGGDGNDKEMTDEELAARCEYFH